MTNLTNKMTREQAINLVWDALENPTPDGYISLRQELLSCEARNLLDPKRDVSVERWIDLCEMAQTTLDGNTRAFCSDGVRNYTSAVCFYLLFVLAMNGEQLCDDDALEDFHCAREGMCDATPRCIVQCADCANQGE